MSNDIITECNRPRVKLLTLGLKTRSLYQSYMLHSTSSLREATRYGSE